MSKMTEVKTAELVGPALDWAVAHATKAWEWAHEWFPTMTLDPTFLGVSDNAPRGYVNLVPRNPMRQDSQPFTPSTDWAQGGRLIDKYEVSLSCSVDEQIKFAAIYKSLDCVRIASQRADTRLIAVCRTIVAAKLGDTVQVPAELLEVANA